MKMNIVTKLIWLAACATVLLSAENVVRSDAPIAHSGGAQASAGGKAPR